MSDPDPKDPAAPYHRVEVPSGGLAPAGAPGGGVGASAGSGHDARSAPQGESSWGSVPGAHPGDPHATASRKLGEERADHENEAGNAPRMDPSTSGGGGSSGHP